MSALNHHAIGRCRVGTVAVPFLVVAFGFAGCGSDEPKNTFNAKPYVGKGHVVECKDFKSQADAQAVLRAETTDPNGLDRDGDGIACPTLPAPKDTDAIERDFVTDKDGAPVIKPLNTRKHRQAVRSLADEARSQK